MRKRERENRRAQQERKEKRRSTSVCVCVWTIHTGSKREKRDDDEKRGEEKGITRAINQCPILMVPSSDPTI
jgi:hypothetical protein